jgi:hypothetical protein
MKKIALVLIMVVIATISMAQVMKIYPVKNTTTAVGFDIPARNFVYDYTNKKLYAVNIGMTNTQTITSARLPLVNVGATGATGATGITGPTGASLTNASTLQGKDTTALSKIRTGTDTAGWNATKAGDFFITTGGDIFISTGAGLHKWVKVN